MDSGSSNPGSRPRKGIVAVLVAMGVVAVVAVAAIVGPASPASASGLEPFASCKELTDYGEAGLSAPMAYDDAVREPATTIAERSSSGEQWTTVGSAIAREEKTAAPTSSASDGADQAKLDATNVVIDGVDELDLIDRIGPDRFLVVAGTKLAIVDLAAAKVVADRAVAPGAQITYDRDRGVVWVVGPATDGTSVSVQRIATGGGGLSPTGTWTTSGGLVDARRVDGTLYLVASDSFVGATGTRVPFEGGPVPCHDVLHPIGQTEAMASLLVSLPADGPMAPTHAAEVVGSGQLVMVTDDAAYVATPMWGTGATTGIHRFDLGDLHHTGSGSVPGSMLNDFSMSEHDGYLRVAVTAGNAGRVGGPMPGGGGVIIDRAIPPAELGGGTSSAFSGVASSRADDAPATAKTAAPTATSAASAAEETDAVAEDGPAADPVAEPGGSTEPGSPGTVEPLPPTDPAAPATTVPAPAPPTTVPRDRSVQQAASPTTVPGPLVVTETTVPAPPPIPEPTVPDGTTTVPVGTTTTEPTTTTAPETTTTTEATTTTSSTSTSTTSTTAVSVGSTIPGPGPNDPFNAVIVLDTDGDLDVVSRTPWFGHPGEHLEGIRFEGDRAYAVTFMSTDPFYVLDLADPLHPRVAGEVELPGFSAYLHPIGRDLVVGFGPGDGGTAVKLFDVSDPAAPKVVDTLALGPDSPVVYDHHAFVDMGDGRFAVPVNSFAGSVECVAAPCPQPESRGEVVEVQAAGHQLRELARVSAPLPEPASRAIPVDGGWALLGGTSIAIVDDDGASRSTIGL